MRTSFVGQYNLGDFLAEIVKKTGNRAYLEYRSAGSCNYYLNKDVAYVTGRLELQKRGNERAGLVGTDIDYTPQSEAHWQSSK
jgi:hypothetical protein